MQTVSKAEIENNLAHFSGTQEYFGYGKGFCYTDGVSYLAESCQCYWLLDVIKSYQHTAKFKKEPFQVWSLEVKDGKGSIRATDGNRKVLCTQEIEYTDFPLDSIRLYLADDVSYKVMLLPGEY